MLDCGWGEQEMQNRLSVINNFTVYAAISCTVSVTRASVPHPIYAVLASLLLQAIENVLADVEFSDAGSRNII